MQRGKKERKGKLSLSHVSKNKDEKKKRKQKTTSNSVRKWSNNPWDPPEKVRETLVGRMERKVWVMQEWNRWHGVTRRGPFAVKKNFLFVCTAFHSVDISAQVAISSYYHTKEAGFGRHVLEEGATKLRTFFFKSGPHTNMTLWQSLIDSWLAFTDFHRTTGNDRDSYKYLSYRRETALQGGSVLAKSGRRHILQT